MAPAGVAVDFSVGAPAFSPYGSVSRGSVKRVVPEVPLPVVTVNAPPPVPDFAQLYKVNVPQGMVFAGVGQSQITLVRPPKSNVLLDRLQMLYQWYTGMVSHSHGRLEYSYSPIGDPEPPVCVIRDIGAIWELELLSHFLDKPELNDVVEHSLDYFTKALIPLPPADGVFLNPRFLGEPSTIAHSAMLLLSLVWDNVRRHITITTKVANALLFQQRADGSFKVHFSDDEDGALWMYGCEALCALAEAYRWLQEPRYAHSVDGALRFYDSQVFLPGFVDLQLLPFFVAWQCHACRLMFDSAGDNKTWGFAPPSGIQHRFADYAYRMADKLVGEGFFEDLTRSPPVTCVAVASALEGLNDAYAMAKVLKDERRFTTYEKCIRDGLVYLMGLQCTRGYGCPEKEKGGFALTPLSRNQRVDFSGPAARAYMKTLTNGIKPPIPVV